MTTASHYFLPGTDGSPPMFDVDTGFAKEFSPRDSVGHYLQRTDGSFTHDPSLVLSACIVAAMGWIRSKGYNFSTDIKNTPPQLVVERFDYDPWSEDPHFERHNSFDFDESDNPDWLSAARWVHEQTKGKA